MKKLLTLKLSFLMLLSSLIVPAPMTSAHAMNTAACENGECVQKLIDHLEELGEIYQKECLPNEGFKTSELKKYYEDKGVSESCWKLITEINYLEEEIEKKEIKLQGELGCESGECKMPHQNDDLTSQINALSKVEPNLSCTEPKKQEIRNQCPDDLNCALAASITGIGGYLAEKMIPQDIKPKNCHLGDDNCVTQLATGFLNSAVNFFKGSWDLLCLAGGKTRQKLSEFWNWVSGAEDHSSTSQLALARASEDPGIFDMLIKDFPGTMKKVWAGFMGSIKEWLKTDIFCEKWSGLPHFSQCEKATESFDCVSCKAMMNGLCSISGAIVAEVVPSFLTGGLITAAKYGASGGVKIAKMFRVSAETIQVVKNSKVAKISLDASRRVDDVLKISDGIRVGKKAAEASLKIIGYYLMSPSRKILKTSFDILKNITNKSALFVAQTSAGKVLTFSGATLKTSGKVLLYPIENPMTAFAFKLGERSFDKAFKLGAPKLAVKSTIATKLVSGDKELDLLLGKIEESKINKTIPEDLAKLEMELLTRVTPQRERLLKEALRQGDVELPELINNLYPELQYGELSKKLSSEKILSAEKEFLREIELMPDGPLKAEVLKKFQAHIVQGEARALVVQDNAPTFQEIVDNSRLDTKKRFTEAMKLLKRNPASIAEKEKLASALDKAHLAGPDNGIFEYSWSELREKFRILTDGGYTKEEADILIRAGLAGRPPVRKLIEPGETLFSGFAEDILDKKYPEKRQELIDLVKAKTPENATAINYFKGYFNNTDSNSEAIVNHLDAVYFIDYSHSVDELSQILGGHKQLTKSTLAQTYQRDAFNNFKDARNYLLTEKPEINKKTLLEVHKRMMKGGVEKVSPAQMGVIRDQHWYGGVPSTSPINSAVKKEIMDNPYLTWVEKGKLSDDSFWGQIQYPNVDHVRKEGLDLIRKNHQILVSEIEEYQSLPRRILEKEAQLSKSQAGAKLQEEIRVLKIRHEYMVKNKFYLTKKLVDAMVDDLMDWFTRERTLLGDISSPEKLDEYVNLISKFQRDLVSIHPLSNGNGRSTREFALSYALMKEGLPPPRIIDPNADIYRSQEEWRKVIKDGILASDFLVDDLTERLKFNLPLENSLEVVTPYSRPPVQMSIKGQKKVTHMDGVEYIDPKFYREIIKREVALDPSLKNEFKVNPIGAWDKVHKKAEEVFAKNNLYYNHPKKGIERVALGYVDDDFKHLYGKPSYDNKELFDFKMKSWYSEDITWRGISSKIHTKSESEIIKMFSELTSHNASNAVVGKLKGNTNPEIIRKAALEDFEKYNKDVFGNGLVQMARDHSETGPMYGISYGYSTSKNRDVGKAFAMGAMVVGEYGAHKTPELQALLKSRVLVGARRANKDVDLGRLKQVREEFSYKYGRQQEVMGIGASDPDAITIVQTIDAQGEVTLSYLRNKNNPKEILVVKGNIDPDATPGPEQVIKTIRLGSN